LGVLGSPVGRDLIARAASPLVGGVSLKIYRRSFKMDKYTLTLFQNFLMQHFTKKDLYYIDNRFLFGDVKDHFKYNPTKYDLVCYLSNPAANKNLKDLDPTFRTSFFN
jgi:hypothetical protein